MLILPFPPASLFPNSKNGRHWGATVKDKKSYYAACFYLAKSAKPEVSGKIQLSITFHQPDNRHRDIDNMLAAIKAGLDGVSKAWGVDDRNFRPLMLDDGEVVKGGKIVIRW